jgi:hypothetical protein
LASITIAAYFGSALFICRYGICAAGGRRGQAAQHGAGETEGGESGADGSKLGEHGKCVRHLN